MKRSLGALLLAVLAAACSSGGGDGQASFAQFVKNQVAKTSDSTDPVEVQGIDFQFTQNEHAFDDVLPPP